MDGLIALALAKKYTDKVKSDIIDAGFKVQVEEDRSILNRQGAEKVLYLLPKEYGYDEFVYANRNWEWIGKTDIDLSDYALKEDVGDLDDLPTTDKSSIVGAISETFISVSNGKAVVASAITDKGVQTSSDATFSEMAQNIENIPSGGGIPISSDSDTPIFFGVAEDPVTNETGFYICTTEEEKTDVAFGREGMNIYVESV